MVCCHARQHIQRTDAGNRGVRESSCSVHGLKIRYLFLTVAAEFLTSTFFTESQSQKHPVRLVSVLFVLESAKQSIVPIRQLFQCSSQL